LALKKKKTIITTHDSNIIESNLIKSYGNTYHIHGLLGQTWRNVEYMHHKQIQGDATEYQVNELMSSDFLYNQYNNAQN